MYEKQIRHKLIQTNMKMRLFGLIAVALLSFSILSAQKNKSFEIKSHDGNLTLKIEVAATALKGIRKTKTIMGTSSTPGNSGKPAPKPNNYS